MPNKTIKLTDAQMEKYDLNEGDTVTIKRLPKEGEELIGCVVKYKSFFYICWNINDAGKCQLIMSSGKKYVGTPVPASVEKVKELTVKEFNGSKYVSSRLGIFSLATGNTIKDTNIVSLFDK